MGHGSKNHREPGSIGAGTTPGRVLKGKRMAGKEKLKKEESVNSKTAGQLFLKEQLRASEKFSNRKDLIEILLEDQKQYSIPEVEEIIEKFMKGKVN